MIDRLDAERSAARAANELDRLSSTLGGQPDVSAGGSGGGGGGGSPALAPTGSTRGPVAAASPPVAPAANLTAEQARRLVSEEAYRTMIAYDTGGRRYYEEALKNAPYWPGYSSGVTIGLGYDLGYVPADKLVKDWGGHLPEDQIGRFKTAVGVTGSDAQPLAVQFADIRIPWDTAEKVFQDTTVTQYVNQADRALPNFRALAPDAAGALVSLVFNRGADFKSTSDKRLEMRNIREHMENKAYAKIPAELRAMKRLWTAKGLQDRREAEAVLFERGLVAMGLLDKPSGQLPAVNAPQTAIR